MPKRKEYVKYQNSDVSTLELVKFYKVDQGNLFFFKDYKHDMLLIRMNERKDVKFERNCVCIAAKDMNYCGLGMYIDDSEEVYVVDDPNIVLRSYYLL